MAESCIIASLLGGYVHSPALRRCGDTATRTSRSSIIVKFFEASRRTYRHDASTHCSHRPTDRFARVWSPQEREDQLLASRTPSLGPCQRREPPDSHTLNREDEISCVFDTRYIDLREVEGITRPFIFLYNPNKCPVVVPIAPVLKPTRTSKRASISPSTISYMTHFCL